MDRTFVSKIPAFVLPLIYCALIQPAAASVVDYTSSAAFYAATAGDTVVVEQYASETAGQSIANGSTLNGLTYTFSAGSYGNTLTGGIIAGASFNSFSGLSLGGNQSYNNSSYQYFFPTDSVTVTFATPVTAVGVFFNVNPNAGNYDLNTPVGGVVSNASAYDTSTFIFAGIISTTPFSTITLASEDSAFGTYNIPEIDYVSAIPLPAGLPLFATGFGVLGLLSYRRKKKAQVVAD